MEREIRRNIAMSKIRIYYNYISFSKITCYVHDVEMTNIMKRLYEENACYLLNNSEAFIR